MLLGADYGFAGQPAINIPWPSNSINLPQLQKIFSQYPGASQFNIQFPNQTNWAVTPNGLQNVVNTFEQEAQSLGVPTNLNQLGFSSLAGGGLQSGLAQLAISSINGNGPNTNLKSQMDNVLRQLQSGSLDIEDTDEGGFLGTIKHYLFVVYQAVYGFFTYLGDQLARLFHK